MLKKILLFVFFAGCFLLSGKKVQAYKIPKYDGPVNDYAKLISDENEQKWEKELFEYAVKDNGVEIAIVTIKSLEGESIEEVAQQFFDTWEIGKEKLDNGVLILVAKDDKQVRIHTGYGVEGNLTDSLAGRIIRNNMIPEFKRENYQAGIEAGFNNVLVAINHPEEFEQENETAEFFGFFMLIAILSLVSGFGIYLAAFLGRSKSWWLGGLIGLILGFVLIKTFGAVLFGIIGLILDYILSKNYKNWKLQKRATNWHKTKGGFFAAGSGKSSSSSGFSFGGGSSGGGGASGSW